MRTGPESNFRVSDIHKALSKAFMAGATLALAGCLSAGLKTPPKESCGSGVIPKEARTELIALANRLANERLPVDKYDAEEIYISLSADANGEVRSVESHVETMSSDFRNWRLAHAASNQDYAKSFISLGEAKAIPGLRIDVPAGRGAGKKYACLDADIHDHFKPPDLDDLERSTFFYGEKTWVTFVKDEGDGFPGYVRNSIAANIEYELANRSASIRRIIGKDIAYFNFYVRYEGSQFRVANVNAVDSDYRTHDISALIRPALPLEYLSRGSRSIEFRVTMSNVDSSYVRNMFHGEILGGKSKHRFD
jgi:hypothetical protein